MKKRHLKIVISSFIIGIIILTIGLFANQSSDIISLGNNQLANTFSSIQQAQTGDLANEEESKGYQPISGINFKAGQSGAGADSDFIALLRTIFNWGIAIAVILATLAVIVGAVQYMTTDAIYDKKEGRQRMTSAIGGLILALMSWLILFTINENIFASNFLLKLQELKEKNAENQESKIEAGENNQELEEALDELSEEVVRNNPPLSQNSADDLLSGYNIIRGPSVSTEGMKINTVNVAGSVSSGCCGGQSPLVLSEGTESDTIANQENEGGVFAFDYNDNFEQQENLDEYFLEVIGEEELNSSTLQTPRRANIDGYEVEVTPTFTGWTVEVLPNQEGYSTNNEEVNSNQKSESGSDFLNNETNQNFDIDSNQQNNDNRLTLQEIIDLNRPNNNSDENNETDFEENELSQDGQNILAFQDQAFENVFVKNEDADIVNMSDQLENMILIFRDECCSGKTTINGTETYKSSFNITDINKNNNSFLIDRNFTNQYGANSWSSLNRLVERNTYPDQNLIEITEYIECKENRSKWSSWLCNKPDNYRDIEGRYYNLNEKGIVNSDLISGETYKGKINEFDTEVIYQNNSWEIKII